MEPDESTLDDVLDSTVDVDDPGLERLLRDGEVEVLGRMPWSSNRTFLASVSLGDDRTQVIYKPEAGERPLWDFPSGLWRREVATFELARGLGWPVVPPTVERREAPLGLGSVQYFVPSDYEEHYFTLRDEPQHRRSLEQLCVLDLIANNTDRKGGHVLLGHDGRIWGIDHGLNFHSEFKLRTVIWDFAGEPIPATVLDDVCAFLDRGIDAAWAAALDVFERDATLTRARAVISSGRFPHDPTGRRHPWPLV